MQSKPIEITLYNYHTIEIPEKIAHPFTFTKDKRVKIEASANGKSIKFYAALRKNKVSGHYKIMFSKAKQKELQLNINDTLTLQLFENTSKYGVDMPEELEEVFKFDIDAFTIFEKLTAGKKRSIIYHIKRQKSSQKKIDVSLIMCENLKRGITDNKEIFAKNNASLF